MPTDNTFYQMDPLYYCILGPAILLMLFAQWRVKSTYDKWGKVPNQASLAGVDVAQRLLQQEVNQGVSIHGVRGQLTDHYNPMQNSLHLSESTINSPSVAAMAVVAHEVGHAHQDATNSMLMRVRSGIVPMVNIGSQLGPVLFLTGLMGQIDLLMWLGIALFSMAFVFALVTLPVEIDASRRALQMLEENNLLMTEQERQGAREVLRAAALTYVAGMMTALFQVIYYITLALRGRRGNVRRSSY